MYIMCHLGVYWAYRARFEEGEHLSYLIPGPEVVAQPCVFQQEIHERLKNDCDLYDVDGSIQYTSTCSCWNIGVIPETVLGRQLKTPSVSCVSARR
jgi:hypothetical protein